ncbi:MAG TPA: condensation domain-containing protein, partial [Thermoanaerobaculia bacterium]
MSLLSPAKRQLLARRLEAKGIGAPQPMHASIPRRPSGPPPLSFAQERLWVLDRLEPGSPFYAIAGVAELRGRLDVQVLARAFAAIVRRHESLRTTFGEDGGSPYQIVAPPESEGARWPL